MLINGVSRALHMTSKQASKQLVEKKRLVHQHFRFGAKLCCELTEQLAGGSFRDGLLKLSWPGMHCSCKHTLLLSTPGIYHEVLVLNKLMRNVDT